MLGYSLMRRQLFMLMDQIHPVEINCDEIENTIFLIRVYCKDAFN